MNSYGRSSPTKNSTRTNPDSDLGTPYDYAKSNAVLRRDQDNNGFAKCFAAAPGSRMYEVGPSVNVSKDNQRYHNATFGSPPNSPLVGLYEPSSSNYWRSNSGESESWSNDKEDRVNIAPIGTGAKKKAKDPSELTQFEDVANNYLFGLQPNKLNSSNCIDEGSLSIDFLAEGEKMVSELCNSFDAVENKWQQANLYKNFNFDNKFEQTNSFDHKNRMIEKSKALIADFEKLHEKIPNEIVQLAVEACTDAENIAIAHHHRPCFKNIHSICAKTRSNVQKPDSAVANLHSQGVPWVIKNFIFSFVRILDGWKGVKELLNEKHDSFSRIENQYYSPEIRECFVEWQVVTKDMLAHIYKTYKCLHEGFILEQKSFTQYHSMARQNKFQPTKNNSANISRISTPASTSGGSWFQSYSHSDQTWQQMRSNPTTKKVFPIPPIMNTNNFIPFPESVNMQNKSNTKSEQCSFREIKARQTWTLSQAAEYVTNQDQREYLAQLRQNMDAENSKSLIFQSNLGNDGDEIDQRKSIDVKAKMIPVSQLERNILPNSTAPSDASTVKIKCCGDANEDAENNWRQVIQKYSNDYFMLNTPCQTSNIMSFSSSDVGLKAFGEEENDENYNQLKSKVYMKPGSYNIPMKPTDLLNVECDKLVKDIVDNSKGVLPVPSALQYEAVNILWSFFEIKPPETSRMQFTYPEPDPSIGVQTDFSTSGTNDKDWEAAKQSATIVMDCFSDNAKPLSVRLKRNNIEDSKFFTDNTIDCSDEECTAPKQPNENYSKSNKPTNKNEQCNDSSVTRSKVFVKSGKRKCLPSPTINKFERIIVSLTKIRDSNLIQRNMDLKNAPHFYHVVKRPMSLSDISIKLANSSYSDLDQVIKDFRKIFTNLRIYLKTYPDPAMKKKINKLSNEFDKLLQEQFSELRAAEELKSGKTNNSS